MAKKKVVKKKTVAKKVATKKPKLLSGGNPQIAKADGNAPVQEYINALPAWKKSAGKKIDQLIEKAVPKVQKAVKWNSPLYGMEGQGFFLGIHSFNNYIKITFFKGAHLSPEPPVGSTQPDVRSYHVSEDIAIDEKQFMAWIKQAAKIPGWKP